MPNVAGIVYARLASPDLDVQETFLLDFGMQRVERTDTKLYMRGSDADPYIHITELGEPKVLGWAYLAASNEDLAGFAQLDGASAVEAIDAPGGGHRGPSGEPLVDHYRNDVIGGSGAFVMTAQSRRHFAIAVRRKLILEIADTGSLRIRR